MAATRTSRSATPLDRREFLRWGGLVGAVATAAGRSGEPSLMARQTTSGSAPPFALQETTIGQLQEAMAAGQTTSRAAVDEYLDRIARLDRRGPRLRAVIEVNPDATSLADVLDRERAGGRVRGPLHGVPILLKDNIGTADRTMTTAGSLALEGSIPERDAEVARRLRAAGAVLLGKANLSEWANFRSTRSSSGWSARGGQCRNPYVLNRNPCGSSSGSAVAVSANLVALAVGTETDGSIVCPSSVNGIVGIKPTVGLVSRAGVIPVAHSQDTVGPMARTVRDAAIVLGIMAGVDSDDPATQTQPEALVDYTTFLDSDGLRGARVGVVRSLFGFHDRADRVLAEALSAMRAAGAVLVDPASWPALPRLAGYELTVLLYEFKADLNAYLASLGGNVPVRSLQELIVFNERHAAREMPFFGQELLHRAQEMGPLSETQYLESLAEGRRLARTAIDGAMDRHRLDVLAAPTAGPAWTTDLVNGDQILGGSSRPAAVAGYPSITVPAGDVLGLPVGISFFGRAWSEPTLLRVAHAFEQATQARRVPRMRTAIDAG